MSTSTQVWLWTVSAGLGVVLQGALTTHSILRLHMIHELGVEDGDRRRVLVSHIRSGLCFLLVHTIFLYIGLRVLIGFNFGAIAWLLLVSSWVLIYAGLSDFGDRMYWRRRQNRRGY